MVGEFILPATNLINKRILFAWGYLFEEHMRNQNMSAINL